MSLKQLQSPDQEIIHQCLVAICESRFLEDGEFGPRIGIEREDLRTIIQLWPQVDDSCDDSDLALGINNTLNELIHGLPISAEDWHFWIRVPKSEIIRVYIDWANRRGWKSTGIR